MSLSTYFPFIFGQENSLNTSQQAFYHKSASERTLPLRRERSYSISDEFQTLQGMYRVFPPDPNNPIVKAYAIVQEKNDTVIYLEKINGKTLGELIKCKDPTIKTIVAKVEAVIAALHQEKWAHGDIGAENILVNEFKQMKLIDPIGYSQGGLDFEEGRREDLNAIQTLKEMVNSGF